MIQIKNRLKLNMALYIECVNVVLSMWTTIKAICVPYGGWDRNHYITHTMWPPTWPPTACCLHRYTTLYNCILKQRKVQTLIDDCQHCVWYICSRTARWRKCAIFVIITLIVHTSESFVLLFTWSFRYYCVFTRPTSFTWTLLTPESSLLQPFSP